MAQTISSRDSGPRHPVDADRTAGDLAVISLKGFCMGIADVIPGISGGTIAFMLEIYEDLIRAIRSFDLRFVRLLFRGKFREASASVAWRFLAALLAGIGCAILLFSQVVTWLMAHHPVLLNAFFFGLILATVPIIARVMKQWSPAKVLVLVLTSVGTFFFVQMVPVSTPETWWFIFLSGALAICAMILPGISGAFILLLLGKYQFILEAIHQREFGTLLIFAAGIVTGILSFVRVLEWLFRRYHDLTIAALTGFVIGSLNKIWPWKQVVQWIVTDSGKRVPVQEINTAPVLDGQFLWVVLLACAGFGVAYLLHAIPQKHAAGRG